MFNKGKKRANDISNTLAPYKYKCKWCGRKEYIRYNEEKTLCTHCGRYVYKDEDKANKYYFAEQLKSSIKSRKKGE